ncbi:alpha-D-ribose 1-methylphosphonate 5-triphosphate diphosphatase [Oceaniovalibus sp. ACAM 378]|uniref:alpha-D-ribose 1-methylphosphonate 5-triphosphate diphosphatase n=1 Tax=Oceaniovalibus sp. ACAM 378 TaxID=2599923 RepID=UPI0011DA9495|nr:alpha-D-ribose 1-methylphosphonate 5-triphosphate diphosphatase [Oceaniovalibus sp. ACAM 378]TYB86659.1 alpha-D-ribose 1-methylphosphonate 5-triphosphate diphosphatase [Oceaniovalibus sp. ACAM 378]
MTIIQNMRLSGATVLRGDSLVSDTLSIVEGQLRDIGAERPHHNVNLTGYWVLPGIIDLHGDAFERHLAPRPTAPFPSDIGLRSVDHEAASNGVTTAWMAQSWSWEGGSRGPAFAETFMDDLAAYRPQALTDLRIQLRCETHTVDTEQRLLAAVVKHRIDYVIFNDHIGEALDMIATDPEALAIWGKRAGRSLQAHIKLVKDTQGLSHQVPRYLCTLATAFDKLGIKYGSHDDRDAATRDYYNMIGARVCEFPTRISPAQVAKANGDPVLMGAPNVVRGGSQSGNVSAEDMIRQGMCDALVSDYHYPSLARAALLLADRGIVPFGQAWQMISTNPARIMGLSDRGAISDGKRADLVIMHNGTRQIEGTIANGRWSHLCGALAARISAMPHQIAHAAE